MTDTKSKFYATVAQYYADALANISGLSNLPCPNGMLIWEAGNVAEMAKQDCKRLEQRYAHLVKMADLE